MESTPSSPAGVARGIRVSGWIGALLFPFLLALPAVSLPRAAPSTYGVVVTTLAMIMLAGLLRRLPLTGITLMITGTAVAAALVGSQHADQMVPLVAADIALGYVVAVHRARTAGAAVVLSLFGQLAVIAGLTTGSSVPGTAQIALMLMIIACVAGLFQRQRRLHAATLRSQEVVEAITAERLRIARELHDMVAHSIGVIAIQAGVGWRVMNTQPEEARKAFQAIETTSRETLAGLRRTLGTLRQDDPSSAPMEPAPGLADLGKLVAKTGDAGVRVDLRVLGEPAPLPPDLDLAAYRIVQEAVTNVVRHAGTGSCVVTVGHRADDLVLEITDQGSGGSADGSGYGIVGMRERVGLLHGDFTAGPLPGGGFRVTARVPLPQAALR
ncbi:sensor histidine kinase [Actinocorallia longicatena]|uniref:histidine kinase n=1 Tax=Actinocorallia longicatena TaxID=111803 RepID=A0ABP6QDS3_9ACTN